VTDRSAERRPYRGPNPFASPWLSASLAALALVLALAVALVSGLLPLPSPTPVASPACSLSATLASPGASIGAAAPSGTCATPTPGPTGPTPEPSFVRPTPTPGPTFTSYVVRVGDTLTSIARAYSTTGRSIAWWNRGAYPSLDPESPAYDPNHLDLGWVLVLLPGMVVDDANPPSPSPAPPSPTPGAGTPYPTLPVASPGAPATVLSHGPRGSSYIALTFDMGGRLDPAVDIVQWLIDHGVHATFFPTGKTASTTTIGMQVMGMAKAHPDLFDIGNHSWDHPDFTTLSAAQMKTELTSTETAVAPLAGQTTRPWFRPPYGAWNAAVRAGVGAAGWDYLVMWDIDTIDWKATADGGPTADDIVTRVLSKAQGGSIVLMHLGGYHTLEALPGILAGLQAKGLVPVTLGEMFGR